jgi:hypothetical protein
LCCCCCSSYVVGVSSPRDNSLFLQHMFLCT